ncbi:MAG: GldM family protein [Crocinitomicaceae bacterium]|nr:GldM family protein [Crocinitomicaceae bacterium]
MAGGKETPRQKMIGMMYLVLTALLALNVSKSILDAFCSIEEGTQTAAREQLAAGDQFKEILVGEQAANAKQNPAKAAKIGRLLKNIEDIDKETGKFIQLVDEAKFHIMKLSGEQVVTAKDKSKEHVVWNFNKKGPKNKYGCTPARLNLYAIQAKDQYDIPMHELVGEEIAKPNPANRGMKIWKGLLDFRSKVCDIVGSYEVPGDKDTVTGSPTFGKMIGGIKYVSKTTKINKFKDPKDLDKQVSAMVAKLNIKHGEDAGIIKDLYKSLTKLEIHPEVNGVANVHWIGKTFDHAPLVAAIASLSQLQLDALTARTKAIKHLKGRVSTGDFSFNKLVAFAGGPGVAEANSPYTVEVVLGAYDSDNKPEATLDSVNGVALPKAINLKTSNGTAILERTAGGETETLSGTISIQSKSGGKKSESWSVKVGVVTSDKEATVEMPEMRVLYAEIDNILRCAAGGQYKSVTLSGGGARKKGNRDYVCKPNKSQIGKTIKFSLKAVTPSGESVSLKQSEGYLVKPCPKPKIFLNGSDSPKARLGRGGLALKYGDNVPFSPSKGSFYVKTYTLFVPGLPQPLTGGGKAIKGTYLKAMRSSGAKEFAISVSYGGTSSGEVFFKFTL